MFIDQDAILKTDGDLWSEQLERVGPIEVDESARAASAHPTSFRYHGVTSHVLIAACRADETSIEYTTRKDPAPRGLFTEALINALHDSLEDNAVWGLTHTSFFERIKEGMHDIYAGNPGAFGHQQTPQCEGFYKDRYVFATPANPHQQHAIAPLTFDRGVYILPIGKLAGVNQHSRFDIYDYSPRGERKLIGRLGVVKVDESSTQLNPGRDLSLTLDAYAVMCTPPIALPIDVTREAFPIWSDSRFQTDLITRLSLARSEPLEHFIVPVRSGQPNKLRISSSSSHSVQIQTMYGSLINIRRSSSASIVPLLSEALAKAVMFFYHLDQSSRVPNADLFDLHVLELIDAPITDWASVDRNIVDALVPNPRSAPISLHPTREGIVIAPPDPKTPFGLQLVNRAPYNFYVYVFYFDPSKLQFHPPASIYAVLKWYTDDFSITPMYTPANSDRTPPPLPARGALNIGFGDSGAAPIHFSIDDHAEKDLGFFKVYYSTVPSDMGTIQQEGFDPDQHESPRPAGSHYPQSPPPYGSVVYPITVTNPRKHRR